ncbi:MAG: hypothetical protein ACI9FJ_000775 [Alteromonadaceae bacterium]|jgi:hypothetical protein
MPFKSLYNQSPFKLLTSTAVAVGLLLCGTANAEDGPPGTDIYVAQISSALTGEIELKNPRKITTRKGYDNQPFFLANGSGILYTAILPMKSGQWQADSFFYHFKTNKHTNLTNSDLSEYSPILMAAKKTFSAIVVEPDGKQLLWSLPYKSSEKAGRLMDLEPVGYHAWGVNLDLVTFVLGEPSTLQYQKNSQKKGKDTWWLAEYQPKHDKVSSLVPLPKGSDYYTWIDDETAVTAVNNVLYTWRYDSPSATDSVADWVKWMDMSKVCKTKITRLAVDKTQQKMAFVCDE